MSMSAERKAVGQAPARVLARHRISTNAERRPAGQGNTRDSGTAHDAWERGVSCSAEELTTALQEWIKLWNDAARRFTWTRTADQIIDPDLPLLLTHLRTGSLGDALQLATVSVRPCRLGFVQRAGPCRRRRWGRRSRQPAARAGRGGAGWQGQRPERRRYGRWQRLCHHHQE